MSDNKALYIIGGLVLVGGAILLSKKSTPLPPAPSITAEVYINGINTTVNNEAHVGDIVTITWVSDNYPVGAYVNVDVVINAVSLGKQIEVIVGSKNITIPEMAVPSIIEFTLQLMDSLGNVLAQTPTTKIFIL